MEVDGPDVYDARHRMPSVDAMIRVSSIDFGRRAEHYENAALVEPVVVTQDGCDRTVMISIEEYRRLKRRDRAALSTDDLPADLVEAVRRSEMDPRHDHLDALLGDWTP